MKKRFLIILLGLILALTCVLPLSAAAETGLGAEKDAAVAESDGSGTETDGSGKISNGSGKISNGSGKITDGSGEAVEEDAVPDREGGLGAKADTDWYINHESDTTYTLSSVNAMQGLSLLVNGGESFAGKTILLGASLTGLPVDPIGTNPHPFEGTFDGNGRSLTNLRITVPADKTYTGLFGYCGAGSILKNIQISGTILNISSEGQIRYVGGIVGFTKGGVENCQVDAEITLTSTMAADPNKPGMIRAVGGVAGQAIGDVKGCGFDGALNIICASNVTEQMSNVAGEIGGIAGIFGDPEKSFSAAPNTISGCVNRGDLNFNVSGAGGKDRFGADLYAHSQAVGGIAGYSMGNVDACVNWGTIYTSVPSGEAMHTATTTIQKPLAGFGASGTGGVVGSLRGNLFDVLANTEVAAVGNPPYNYYRKNGGKAGGAAALPQAVKVTDCTNRGIVIGLSGVGGIVGNSTGWSLIEGCANRADVMGTRWNKPFSAGIAGMSQSDILNCYNRGDIYSTAGAGYYCAGISGQFLSDNTTATPDNERVKEPLLTGCYTTGRIYLDDAGFRSGILVGENTGLIQNNAFIPGITPDNKIVDTNSGTVRDTIETAQFSVADLKGSKGIGRLNTWAAGKGDWEMVYVKDKAGVNGGYPVLVRAGGDPAKMSLPSAGSLVGVPVLAADASYSASMNPVPRVTITGLVQNADFFVSPQSGSAGANVSATITYTGQVRGMGEYSGTVGSVSYRILAAPISACVIQAEPQVYHWGLQRPTLASVNLYDEAGNLVDKSQYSVSDEYDPAKGVAAHNGLYYDYTNAHGRYYFYPVIVTAKAGANYAGKTKQAAWRIKSASMVAQRPPSDPQYNPLLPESVTYGKTYFDINQNGMIEENEKFDTLKGTDDETGASIQIPWTGSPIYPRVEQVTYKGRQLREATNYDYFERPLDFDYKYVYGNPNPEVDDGVNAAPVHVSKPNHPETMTTRFTNGANFENYNNVFYRIVPRDVSDLKLKADAYAYTGKAVVPTFTLFGKDVGDHYVVQATASNQNPGTGQITIAGRNNLTGVKTFTFRILAANVSGLKLKKTTFPWTGKSITPTFTLNGKDVPKTDYTVTAVKSNKAIGKASITIKGKGNLTGTRTFSFTIQPANVKLKSLQTGKKSLTVNWKKSSSLQKIGQYQIRYQLKGAGKWKVKTVSQSLQKVSCPG